MATLHLAAVPPANGITGRKGLIDKYFYFAMSLLAVVVAVWGFHYTIDANLLHPSIAPPFIIWIHAAVFSLWLVFFVVQSALVRTRNVKLHRSFGWFGAVLGAIMAPLGTATAIVMCGFEVHQHHQTDVWAFLIIQFYDMAMFAGLFALAIAFRKKPEFHRRLMFIASYGLLDVAFARNLFFFHHGLFYLCVDLLIALGAARDILVDGRVHKVYLIALPILLVAQGFAIQTWLNRSDWWLTIAHSIVG